MQIDDFEGRAEISSEEALLNRLQGIRRGEFGAFILSHQSDGPTLFVHLNGPIACVHYFRSKDDHPGCQPRGMTPVNCPASVKFLQVNGLEADSLSVPSDALITQEAAYAAAIEFFHSPDLPSSITWFEL